MNYILGKLMQAAIFRKLAAPIAAANKFLKGRRTELCAVLYALTYAAEAANALTHEAAEQIRTALVGTGLVTFADKIQKHKDIVDESIEKIRNTPQD